MSGERDSPLSPLEILATMGHELRAPLTSIRGFTRLLLDRWDRLDDADKREMLVEINRDSERVARLISDLLDLSRIEAGRLTLRREPVSVRRVVERCAARVGTAFPQLRCETGVVDVTVEADADKLEQIVLNLIENGARYATDAALSVRAYAEDGYVVVEVADRGPGIAENERERIFELFGRRESEAAGGTGVGLWVSRALARAHGGSLAVEPNRNGGSTFALRLPENDLSLRRSAGQR